MIKRTVTYTDLITSEEVTEDLYFHLNKAEVLRIVGRAKGDWEEYVKSIVDTGDTDVILDFLESIIKQAYGQRSEDGRTFRKDKEQSEDFMESEAYAELFVTFLQDPDSVETFFRGVVGDHGSVAPTAVKKGKK